MARSDMRSKQELGEHMGSPIVGLLALVKNTGDGLSKSMTLDGGDFQRGERVVIALEAIVVNDDYPPIIGSEPGGPCRLRWHFRAETAQVLAGEAAEELRTALTAQAERIKVAEAEARGEYAMDKAIEEAHTAGEHVEFVGGCAQCELERDLTKAGL